MTVRVFATVTATQHVCVCLCKVHACECAGVVTPTVAPFNGRRRRLRAAAYNILVRNANTTTEDAATCSSVGEGAAHGAARRRAEVVGRDLMILH